MADNWDSILLPIELVISNHLLIVATKKMAFLMILLPAIVALKLVTALLRSSNCNRYRKGMKKLIEERYRPQIKLVHTL
ncbi:MAG: hypothetical protein PUP92_13455 [Rhizonema sp. PD38]|nr:hypothetical protein [Rhizonema sp. PD38]